MEGLEHVVGLPGLAPVDARALQCLGRETQILEDSTVALVVLPELDALLTVVVRTSEELDDDRAAGDQRGVAQEFLVRG